MATMKKLLPPLLLACGGAVSTSVTPIGKVIQLLTEMHAKGTSEKDDEATRFSAFSEWCKGQSRIKMREVKKGGDRMEMLSAETLKAKTLIRNLNNRINELEEDVGRWKKDQNSASTVRKMEKTDFKATQLDYGETLDALNGAITVLRKQEHDRPQAEQLIQLRSVLLQAPKVPQRGHVWAGKAALAAFLQSGRAGGPVTAPEFNDQETDEMLMRSNPEAHGYESSSGGIVGTLQGLKDQFSTEKYNLEKDELAAQHAYEQIIQQLTDNTENAKHEVGKKRTRSGEEQAHKSSLEGDHSQTDAARNEDQTYLDDTRQLCSSKTTDFESRQQLRGEELASIQEAVNVLSSDEVSGSGGKHLRQSTQTATALVQLRNGQDPVQRRLAEFLAGRAQAVHSNLLAMASERVASDPFTKVKKMIKTMISKLMQDAVGETEHHGWCQAELGSNKISRESKSEEVASLTNTAEGLTNDIVELSQDITNLAEQVSELDKAMTESAAERAQSKERNEATISDAKQAQAAVTRAIAVLKEFYAKSAQAESFVQQAPASDAPETFTGPYKGLLPEGGNVVDFLEVILSDFARLESDTSTSEAMDEDAYKKWKFESEKDKALKENAKGHKDKSRSNKETDLHDTNNELKGTQVQLDKANAYYDELKPSCVDSGVSYEDRVKRRADEMQSLKEALQILAGTDMTD